MMNAKEKKKSKMRRVKWGTGIIIVVLAAGAFMMPKGNGGYEEEAAKTGDITTYYSFSGTAEAKSRQNVISKKEMHINEVVVKPGDHVKKGDVLIKTANEEIKAEIDGEVAQIYTKSNSHAYAGTQLLDIADYSNIQTDVKVDEYDLKYIKVGQTVNVKIKALDQEVQGKVSAISKEAKNENGVSYFTATIALEQDEAVRVGMSAEAKLLKQQASKVTTVSMDAVQFDRNNQPYVLRSENGKPVKQYIEAGINDGSVIEIKSGIRAGDIVLIPSESGASGGMDHGQMMVGGNQ